MNPKNQICVHSVLELNSQEKQLLDLVLLQYRRIKKLAPEKQNEQGEINIRILAKTTIVKPTNNIVIKA